MDTDPKNDFAHLLDDSGLETDGDQYKKKKPNHNKPMGTLKHTDKSLQAIHNHMLGEHGLDMSDSSLDAIIEVVKLAEGERVPDAGKMIEEDFETWWKSEGSNLYESKSVKERCRIAWHNGSFKTTNQLNENNSN
jgi:hypothetical protein